MLPFASIEIPSGAFNDASVAKILSPLNPKLPLPAIVVTTPVDPLIFLIRELTASAK